MIDMEQLIADRDAGTDGPWVVVDDEIWDIRSDGEPGVPMFRRVQYHRLWGRTFKPGEQTANSKRILRLPDLETAFIEAVAVLEGIADNVRAGEAQTLAKTFLTRHNITNETALARAHVAGMEK